MHIRIVDPADIPSTIFDGTGTIIFPDCLASAYRGVLSATGNLERALTITPDGQTGGPSSAAAADHFVSAFSGSCARLKLAALDPKRDLQDASDLFMRAFSGGKVALLDAPCGAGAASAALLSTIAELRRLEVIPRVPLDVHLVAGDISPDALSYAAQMLEGMRAALRRQGITVHPLFRRWDLLDELSTTELLHAWMVHAPECREHFLLMANFSAFLHSSGNFKNAKNRLEEMFRWAAVRRSTVVWIEPQTNIALESVLPRVIKAFFVKTLELIGAAKPSDPEPKPLLSNAHFRHPLRVDGHSAVRLSLVKLTRNPG